MGQWRLDTSGSDWILVSITDLGGIWLSKGQREMYIDF